MTRYLNIAAYKFVALDDLPGRRTRLRDLCARLELKGTILLSPEGINLFLAGLPEQTRELVQSLRAEAAFSDLEVKESYSDHQPFNRMLVRLKREIIAFGVDEVEPQSYTSPKLAPPELKRWLDEGRDLLLLDVRNDYEVQVGTFAGAQPIGIDHFRDFPAAVERLPASVKEKPVVMFCTGGIRCEKAGPMMERAGFKNVLQLEGGILKYFEQCGGDHYDGDCFVFDRRVAVDPHLQETDAAQCYRCQAVLDSKSQQSPHYVAGRSCPFCYRDEEREREQLLSRRRDQIRRAADPLPGSIPYDNWRPINMPERLAGKSLIDSLCSMHPHVPRDTWLGWIQAGDIIQRRRPVTPDRVVHAGEQFKHRLPDTVEPPVNAAIDVLWEDEAIVVVSKPAPLPMHPCGRFNRNSLTWILGRVYHPEVLRVAHRLDANTSGVVVLSRKRAIATAVQEQFEQQSVRKVYLAGCLGHPAEDDFVCRAPISRTRSSGGVRTVCNEGLRAETRFRVRERYPDGTSLLEARPVTGRTNQIRIHLWHLGLPILGDPVYLPEGRTHENRTLDVSDPPMQLHAASLALRHPLTGDEVTFEVQPPNWR